VTEELTPTERPKRLSLSQIVELLLTRPVTDRSSVTLTRNASGETQIAVHMTGDDAEREATEAYDRLGALYPSQNGHDDAEVSLTRNAKGETQMTVSAKTSDRLPSLDAVNDGVREAYDKTRMKYPMADGRTAKPGSVA